MAYLIVLIFKDTLSSARLGDTASFFIGLKAVIS